MSGMIVFLLLFLLQQEPPATGPWIESVQPPKAGPGSRIRLLGRGLAKDGVQTWVKVHPDIWIEADCACSTEIVLRLPHGGTSGPIQVRVGGEAGNTRQLEMVSSYRTPVPEDAIVRDKDGFALTTLCDLSVAFKDFYGFPEAEAIAKKHGGTVVGYVSSVNLITLRFKTRDFQALDALAKEIEKEPGVKSALMQLGLRPR